MSLDLGELADLNALHEQATYISMGLLPVGTRFSVIEAKVIPDATFGRAVRLYFMLDGAKRFTNVPKRYAERIQDSTVANWNTAAEAGLPLHFAFEGLYGSAFKVGFYASQCKSRIRHYTEYKN